MSALPPWLSIMMVTRPLPDSSWSFLMALGTEAPMRECVVLLAEKRGTVAVVDAGRRVAGVVTAGDLARLRPGMEGVGKVVVGLRLDPRIQPKTDASAEISAVGLVGDLVINFNPGTAADPLRGLFEATIGGKPTVVEYEPDSDLRDTEQVPLLEEGGIEAFIRREVLPYTPDAWIKEEATKIGYEVSFTRHFYKPQPLRSLEEISADILAIDQLDAPEPEYQPEERDILKEYPKTDIPALDMMDEAYRKHHFWTRPKLKELPSPLFGVWLMISGSSSLSIPRGLIFTFHEGASSRPSVPIWPGLP